MEKNLQKLAKVAGFKPRELHQLNDHGTRNQLVSCAGAPVTGEIRRLWRDRKLKICFNLDAEHLDTLILYPNKDREPTESEAECIARDRFWSEYFFDQGAGNRMKGVEGTLWAAYNGVTEWMDHRKVRQTADQRLASIWFGEANRTKARALTVAVEMLPRFRN